MGKRWANIPQWDWMTERIPQYKERAALGLKREFFKETTEDLIKTFTLAPTEEAIRVLGLETARQAVWDLYSSQAHPVYQKLYWEKGLEECVNDECKHLHGGPLSQLDAQKRFAVCNRIILELYKRESEEVHHIVNEAREGRRTDPLTNEDISRNLTELPRTLKQFGENIVSKTDWSGVIAFGGPHPSYDGKVYTYIHPVGTTKEGLTFDEFLGKEAYLEWVSQLDAFFDACYDDDDRARCSGGSTPAAAGQSRGTNKSGLSPSSSNTLLENAVPKQPENKQEDRRQSQALKSEYERTREINMARNKIVLGILDSTIGCGEEPEVLVKELTKVGIELDAQELKQTLDKIKLLCSRSPTTDHDAGSPPQSLTNSVDGDPLPKEPVASTTEGSGVPAVPVNGQHVDAGSMPAIFQDPPAPTDVPMANEGSQHRDVVLSNSQEIPAAGNGDMRVEIKATEDSAGGGMEQAVINDDKETGKGLASKMAVSLADLEASLPSYLKPIWKYLLSVSKEDAWCSLLYHFVQFEVQDHGNGANQPEWRIKGVDSVNPSAFMREVPPDADWTSLARSGTTGIYTVVMAVSWWILKAGAEWAKDVGTLVGNITWALKAMGASGSANEIQDKETGFQ
ncbi:hypothetical protein H1R20_g12856, partial [Candolleomyces eurysporus]